MQASNLQNLPENYTMRFCLYLSRLETAQAPLKDSHNRWAGIYHLMSWPQLSYVAEDHKGRIVGYVLSKMWARLNSSRIILSSSHLPLVGRDEPDEDNPEGETHGHVNSISVLREYRRLGIARKMMLLSRLCYRFGFFDRGTQRYFSAEDAMEKIYGAAYCSLHVRKSNKAAIALYKETLGFEVAKVEKKYCEYIQKHMA